MKKTILFLSILVLSGCGANISKLLNKAAKVATGPCGEKVLEAVDACQEVK